MARLGGLELQSCLLCGRDRHGPPYPERAAGRLISGELLMTAEQEVAGLWDGLCGATA